MQSEVRIEIIERSDGSKLDLSGANSAESDNSETSDNKKSTPSTTTELKPKTPRPMRVDIQILRAISIILVVLYHLGIPFATGGFIGVDIFFVISGYLVTGSFVKDLLKPDPDSIESEEEENSNVNQNMGYYDKLLSFIKPDEEYTFIIFIGRRVKRLVFPSYICLLLILIGVYVVPIPIPEGLESVRAAALNYINFYLWKTSGTYGGDNTKTNIVLHFWSLAVEWQYYFISPLVLLVVKAITKQYYFGVWTIRVMYLVFGIPSFVLCFFLPVEAKFYLLLTRIWEFLIGAFVSLEEIHIPKDKIPKFVPIVFMLALCVGGWHINVLNWPNAWTLYVAVLTCIVILCQADFDGKHSLGTVRFLTLLGDWSYSIYLYHWPVIIFARVYLLAIRESVTNTFFWGTCLFLMMSLALVSYYVVEKKTLKITTIPPRMWIGIFFLVSAIIACGTLGHVRQPPIPDSVFNNTFELHVNITNQEKGDLIDTMLAMVAGPNVWLSKDDQAHAFSDSKRNIELLIKRNESRCVIIIGDSHAQQFHTIWNNTANIYNASFYRITRGCTDANCYLDIFINPLPIPSMLRECKSMMTFIGTYHYEYTEARIDAWKSAIVRVALDYARRGQVFFYEDLQWSITDPRECIRENAVNDKRIMDCNKTIADMNTKRPRYSEVIASLSENTNIAAFDILPYITTKGGLMYAYNSIYPMMFDNNHLSENLMLHFSSFFDEMILDNKVFQRFISSLAT